MKCMNEGCGLYRTPHNRGCADWEEYGHYCHNYTTEPTVSITKARLEELEIVGGWWDRYKMDDIKELKAKIAELEEQLKDRDEAYRKVMEEKCPPDEKHCTCVPFLRERIAELEADRDRLDWLEKHKFKDSADERSGEGSFWFRIDNGERYYGKQDRCKNLREAIDKARKNT